MAFFGGDDPKDEIIRLLKDQLAQRDARIEDLEKTILSLIDRAAFAIRYPRATVQVPSKPAEPNPLDLRDVPYRPTFTRSQIEDQFKQKSA